MKRMIRWLLLGAIILWPLLVMPTSETTWRPLAEQGDTGAQFNLGVMYDEGRRIPRDAIEAVHWYHKAAEQGHVKAQYRLGIMYAAGKGVPEDYAEAMRWLRMAAEQGHFEAQYTLGVMYERSVHLPENNVQAYAWYIVAAAQDNRDTKVSRDARMSKEGIAESMDHAEIAAAQKLAREYWEAYVLPFRN